MRPREQVSLVTHFCGRVWHLQVPITHTWQTRRLLARAWQALLALDTREAEFLASCLERSHLASVPDPDALDCAIAALRAALLAVQDDVTGALALARRAQQPFADGACRSLAAMICRWAHWNAGELAKFHSAVRAPWRPGARRCSAITAIFDLNLEAAVEFGRLRLAVAGRLAAEALERARRGACSESAAGLLAAALVAQVAYEQGQLEEAEVAIRYRLSVIRAAAPIECVTRAYIILARLAVHRRRSDSALIFLRDAQALGEKRGWPRLVATMLAERVRILLDDNEKTAALSSLQELEALLSSSSAMSASARADIELHCQHAQMRLRTHRVSAAETAAAAASLRSKALGRSDLRLALEMHLVSVAAYAQHGELFEAQERLIDALEIGAANGLCMTFVDAGPAIHELLAQLCHAVSIADERVLDLRPYIHTLVARCPGSQILASGVRQPPEIIRQPLTPRENNILRLIAGGLSNKRIARRLDITPETVKSHAKSIFAKLAAQTRAQAVAHAEALGLI
jgi:ATP/maltotriose-dependent transcriptional regulator MalT